MFANFTILPIGLTTPFMNGQVLTLRLTGMWLSLAAIFEPPMALTTSSSRLASGSARSPLSPLPSPVRSVADVRLHACMWEDGHGVYIDIVGFSRVSNTVTLAILQKFDSGRAATRTC
jgi:hypothetical protein